MILGRLFSVSFLGLLGACDGMLRCSAPVPLTADALESIYAQPLDPPQGGMRVYHLGHSLVGRDMPGMIAQLAMAAGIAGHGYESQLGWGASLRTHWEPRVAVPGFDQENTHPRFRPAREAVASGDYGAVVLTEMIELRDAIRWHDSAEYLHRWAQAAGGARVYLYETWHHLDDPQGWLSRLDGDAGALWEGTLIAGAMARRDTPVIRIIPAGRVMAEVARRIAAQPVPGLAQASDLFARNADGSQDTIHFSDLGAYLVALTHLAVLYHIDPRGLPHEVTRADGTPAQGLTPEGAALIQSAVHDVVRSIPGTGVRD
jgi:hypothetical protein